MISNTRSAITLIVSALTIFTLFSAIGNVAAKPAKDSGYLGIPGLKNGDLSHWSKFKKPSNGSAKVIGGAANGCITGAETLPESGKGFVSIRRHRNRFYGHPDTVALIKKLGAGLAERTDKLVMIGDLAQPRGGKMSSMHRSHQNGLDADIWLSLASSVRNARWSTMNKKDPPTMVASNKVNVNKRWGEHQKYLLKTAAMDPKVDRIFINPAIKRELCKTEKGDRKYLRKLRAWWGHHAHFHVRMKCPKNSPGCKQQPTIPVGEGCKSLAMWFRPKPKPKKKKVKMGHKKPVKKRLPKKMAPGCIALYKQSFKERGSLAQK